MDTSYYEEKDRTLADRAIDGLFGGLLGGAVMVGVMVIAGMVIGENALHILERFGVGQATTPAAGAMNHLAVSAVYGVGFSLLTILLPRRTQQKIPAWLAGLIYGALLMLLAVNVILPGARSALAELPLWVIGVGHAVYGIVLGQWAFPRIKRSPKPKA
jgi:uncharacterized BrkB/YihY/UPF0761 family membrane protein